MSSLFRSFSFKRGSCSSTNSSSTHPNQLSKDEESISSTKRIFKEEISFKNINQKIDDWTLPPVATNTLYQTQEKRWFSKSDYIIRTVEESILVQPEKEDFYLLSAKSIEKHRKEYNFLHIGCVQIAIKPLIRRGLNVSCLVCLQDTRHYTFEDSLLATAEVGLHDGPVYFNCYPDRMVQLQDNHVLEAIKLKIKLCGLNMKPGSIPATLIYRIQYKLLNSSTSLVLIPPDKDQTIVFLTDHTNANLSIPKTIMWKDVQLPDDWVMEKATQPIPKPLSQISRITQTSDGTVRLSFDRPRRSYSQTIRSGPSIYEDCRSIQTESSRFSCSSIPRPPSVIYMPQTVLQTEPSTQTQSQNISIQGVDNTSNIPHATYEESIPSPTYSSMGDEPRVIPTRDEFSTINVLERDFQIDKQILQKEFYSEKNTLQREWFFQNFKGSDRKQIQENFYRFLEKVQMNISFFDWFNAYAQTQKLNYPFVQTIDVIKKQWKDYEGEYVSSEFLPPKTVQIPQMYDDKGQILLTAPFRFKNIEKPVEPTDIKKIFEQNNYTNLYLQQLGDYFAKTPNIPNIVSEQPKSKIETPLFKPFQLNPQIKSDFQNKRVDFLKKVE